MAACSLGKWPRCRTALRNLALGSRGVGGVTFMAACSLGKWPRCRTALRNLALRLSTAVGAGNSDVVVDLPLCGPMLSPRVPHHVPIPGPRMERETPGQRPRPNYGHPQVRDRCEVHAPGSDVDEEQQVEPAQGDCVAVTSRAGTALESC